MSCLLCESEKSSIVWEREDFQVARCDGCKVLFALNAPSQDDLNTLYDKGKLTGAPLRDIGREDGPPPAWKQNEQVSILKSLERFGMSGGSLLDVGAFSGMFLQNAKQYGFQVIGIEPIGEAYFHLTDVLGLQVVHGDLHSTRFPSDYFTVVSLLDVIEHVVDPVAELREVLRILKPGGFVVMTTPNIAGLIQTIVGGKRKIFGQPWCPIDDIPWHLWGFTPRTFSLCMEKAGFHVKTVDSLEPSPLSTNANAGFTAWKKLALRITAEASKLLHLSDRMVGYAQKKRTEN
ncbi:MAG TPA: class I SAM-dependent methyltransferase [Candidatus Acidoferrales bacterium]|nr:class I SAM-dependent methyltransferase [Candidatus Acidoferrales bacterium]